MKNYVIVAEVPKLKIPSNSSIKITDFKNDFFIYPCDIINTLNNLNKNIKNCKNGKEDKAELHLNIIDLLDVDKKENTFLISELDINLETQGDEILEVVKNHFKFLLNLFSLIFRELFYIKTVYIFKNQSIFYDFVRMIKIPIFHKELSNVPQLIQFVHRKTIENLFPILILRLKKNNQYLPFIEELLFSQIRAGNIIVKFMVGWNTLEHLTNIYWELRKETKLYEKNKVKEINSSIRNFTKKDIKFPYISSKEIKKRVFFNNSPPVLTLIHEMCKRIHLKLDDDEFLTIEKVHYIRNKLFHRVYDISELNEKFSKKFKSKDFQTKNYGYLIRKFMLILEKIILRQFQFIPACFQIKKSNEYLHYLKKKKIKVYSIRKEKDIVEIIQDAKKKEDLSKLDIRNFNLRHYLEAKQKIFFRGKYISLLNLLNKLKKKIENLLENSIIIGEVDTIIHGKRRILLQFKDNLKGVYYSTRDADNTVVQFVKPSTQFISISHDKYSQYLLMFELLVANESSRFYAYKKQIKINGEFLTLLIDIKKK